MRGGPPANRPGNSETPTSQPAESGAGERGPVAALSFRVGDPRTRRAALRRLLGAVADDVGAPRLVLLPGVCAGWPPDGQLIARVAVEHQTTVLFECVRTGWRVAVPTGELLPWASWQLFGDSKEADRTPTHVHRLVAAGVVGGERRLRIGGRDLGLLACGENNVLRNAQNAGNAVVVRHDASDRLFPGATLVLNSAHTEIGNLGKLHRRFAWLSADPPGGAPRLALFVTNNTLGTWGRTLGAWGGGERLANGWRVDAAGEALGVRLVGEPMDQGRALVVDRGRGGRPVKAQPKRAHLAPQGMPPSKVRAHYKSGAPLGARFPGGEHGAH